MTADAWQAHVTREAAKAIGAWLDARGGLHRPVAALTLADLDAMAGAAISRFIVLASERVTREPHDMLTRLLLGPHAAPSAAVPRAGSATCTGSAGTATPSTASARCAASTPGRPSPPGGTA